MSPKHGGMSALADGIGRAVNLAVGVSFVLLYGYLGYRYIDEPMAYYGSTLLVISAPLFVIEF